MTRARGGLPAAAWFTVVIATAGAAGLWSWGRFEALPSPAGAGAAAGAFSEARAAAHIVALSEGVGYRPVGSRANEVEAPAYVLREVERVRAAAEANVRSRGPLLPLLPRRRRGALAAGDECVCVCV